MIFEVYIIINEDKRQRYIGFIIKSSSKQPSIKKEEMKNEISLKCNHLFNKDCKDIGIYLIRFDGKKGIVKCDHTAKENTIELLKSIKKISSNKVDILTLGTSGTIKTLIRKHMTD